MKGIAVLPPGLEAEGAKELITFGATNVCPLQRSASFEADMPSLYRLYLQARLPFRLLREIARFECCGPQELYFGIQNSFDLRRWLHPSMSFRVDVSGVSPGLNHSYFTALQVKNAVVDMQKVFWGNRSDIKLEEPDICLHLYLSNGIGVLSLDGSGSSLHKRGYRAAMGKAPLKENLAAGLIRLTEWDGSVPLIDPLCGSGTLLIEAASIALNFSAGMRRSFLLKNWSDFDLILWNNIKQELHRKEIKDEKLSNIIGCDNNIGIANQAKDNVKAAGLETVIEIQSTHFRSLHLPNKKGVIVCNPPYGKRVGNDHSLEKLYEDLGIFAKQNASGWQLWLLSGNAQLTRSLRMKAIRRIPISNGGIDCRWLKYLVH